MNDSSNNKALKNYSRFKFPSLLISNTRSLMDKLDDIECVLQQNQVDIAVLTETWCGEDIPDSAIHLPKYYVFRND